MIEQTSFLGMPLKTQKQRRLLVALYYATLISFAAVGLWMNKRNWGPLVAQTFVFGGLLGGIRRWAGQVMNERYPSLERTGGPCGLNLSGRKRFDSTSWTSFRRTGAEAARYGALHGVSDSAMELWGVRAGLFWGECAWPLRGLRIRHSSCCGCFCCTCCRCRRRWCCGPSRRGRRRSWPRCGPGHGRVLRKLG